MIVELGRKSQIEKPERLRRFSIDEYLKNRQIVPKKNIIICGLEQDGVEGERIFICETRKDVQNFWLKQKRAVPQNVQVSWYHTAAFQ
jgi:hypothetical protein